MASLQVRERFGMSIVVAIGLGLSLAAAAPDSAAQAVPKPAAQPCRPTAPKAGETEIVICAERPQGYRIDPDVLSAKRKKKQNASRPSRPTIKDNSCAIIGPMGCRGNPGIDLINAVNVLGTIANKISKGENVGEVFVTDPQPDEYQLYKEAKQAREAKEAEAAAKAKAKAAAPPPADLSAKAQIAPR